MYRSEANGASMGELIELFRNQKRMYHSNARSLAAILRAIGYCGSSDEDVIMAFIDDGTDAPSALEEVISNNGDQNDDWRTSMIQELELEETFCVKRSEIDETLFRVVRDDTDTVLFDCLEQDEAQMRADALNEEVNEMTEELGETAHLNLGHLYETELYA